jgi:hypothetical protein
MCFTTLMPTIPTFSCIFIDRLKSSMEVYNKNVRRATKFVHIYDSISLSLNHRSLSFLFAYSVPPKI